MAGHREDLAAGGVLGMLAGGALGDMLLHRGYLNGRILVSAVTAAAAVVFFVPALVTESAMSALPWLVLAALALSAQTRRSTQPAWTSW